MPFWAFSLELAKLGADLYADALVQRAVLARNARKRGGAFIHLNVFAGDDL